MYLAARRGDIAMPWCQGPLWVDSDLSPCAQILVSGGALVGAAVVCICRAHKIAQSPRHPPSHELAYGLLDQQALRHPSAGRGATCAQAATLSSVVLRGGCR